VQRKGADLSASGHFYTDARVAAFYSVLARIAGKTGTPAGRAFYPTLPHHPALVAFANNRRDPNLRAEAWRVWLELCPPYPPDATEKLSVNRESNSIGYNWKSPGVSNIVWSNAVDQARERRTTVWLDTPIPGVKWTTTDAMRALELPSGGNFRSFAGKRPHLTDTEAFDAFVASTRQTTLPPEDEEADYQDAMLDDERHAATVHYDIIQFLEGKS